MLLNFHTSSLTWKEGAWGLAAPETPAPLPLPLAGQMQGSNLNALLFNGCGTCFRHVTLLAVTFGCESLHGWSPSVACALRSDLVARAAKQIGSRKSRSAESIAPLSRVEARATLLQLRCLSSKPTRASPGLRVKPMRTVPSAFPELPRPAP